MRDRNAVVVDRPTRGELAEEPAILQLVIQYDRIAGGIGAIRDREPGPERTSVHWPDKLIAVLVVNSEDEIDHLHIVVRSYFAVGVGRVYPETEDVEIVLVGQSFKICQWTRNGNGRA